MAEEKKVKEEVEEEVKLIPEQSEEAKLKQGESAILKDSIEHEYPGLGLVRINHPTMKITSEVDDYYTKEFNRLLRGTDLPTISEMEEILKDRGTWGDKQESELEQVKIKVQKIYVDISTLRQGINKHNKKVTAKKVQQLQQNILKFNERMIELITRKSLMYEGTVERKAEKEATLLKIVRCVTKSDSEPVWANVEELLGAVTLRVQALINDCNKFWEGISDPLFEQSLDQAFGDLDTEQA